MSIIIDNKLIDVPIINILNQIKSELTNGKLGTIKDKHSYISVPCPFHSNGLEKHNSCSVYCGDDPNIQQGVFNCFSCSQKGSLCKFIGGCFDADAKFGKEWLLTRFGNTIINNKDYLKPIEIIKPTPKKLDESILNTFQKYHPYMEKRKLTPEVIQKYKIRYDPISQCIIFPVWDEHNNLIMLTKRSVNTKQFYIDENIEKPIYLLNYTNNKKSTFVCESQINTLTLNSWGFQAVGTIGCNITPKQYNILNKSGIRHFILCFDGDNAGKKATRNFIQNINKDILVDVIEIPPKKDVNDLTREEFIQLPILDSQEWLSKYKNH